jgi:hypothetical protein
MAGFPTLTELLNSLAFLGEQPAAIGALTTAILIVVLRDWRWSLLGLTIQYVLTSWLLTQVFESDIAPAIAAIRVMAWMVSCLVLYITARQVRWGEPRPGNQVNPDLTTSFKVGRWSLPTSLLFRLLISLIALIVILYTTSRGELALPEVPAHLSLASISLMAMGLLALGLTEEPLTAGMGLLTFMAGFELFYHSLEQGITVIGFLIGIDFLITIVTAYLTVARHWTPKDAERRRPT